MFPEAMQVPLLTNVVGLVLALAGYFIIHSPWFVKHQKLAILALAVICILLIGCLAIGVALMLEQHHAIPVTILHR